MPYSVIQGGQSTGPGWRAERALGREGGLQSGEASRRRWPGRRMRLRDALREKEGILEGGET